MKILKFLQKKNKKAKKIADFYQDSIERVGKDQIQKIVDRGMSLPIFTL